MTDFRRGHRLTAEEINQIAVQVTRLIRTGRGLLMSYSDRQMTLEVHPKLLSGGGGGGVRKFTSLSDTPDEYASGDANNLVAVNAAEDAVEFSGIAFDTVETLPAIPASGAKIVFWTSTGAGTGDDQLWGTTANLTKWYPMLTFTDKSGSPP